MVLERLAEMLRRKPKAAPMPIMREVAPSSMEALIAPYIGELPINPQSPAREAVTGDQQARELQVYRQTLRDERCASALTQRLDAAVAIPWEVRPGGTTQRDKQAAADLEKRLGDIKFKRICRQLLHGVWYGWAVAEIVWKRDGNRVGIRRIKVRSPDRFWWDVDGSLLLRTIGRPDGERVPDRKFVVLSRPGEHDDLPYAPGIGRWCFWPVWFRRHGLQFWAIALERFGTPSVVGKYHPSATPAEQEKLLELVQAVSTGTGVAIPEDMMIDLLDRLPGSGYRFEEFCRYCDQLVTTTILGQSSTTDQGPWRGTAEVQKDVRDETIASDVQLLDEILNDTVARWLTEWNFPGAAVPVIHHDAEPADDLDARASREEKIGRTSGLRPTQKHVEEVYGGEWEKKPAAAPVDDGDADPENDPENALSGSFDPPFTGPAGVRTHGTKRPGRRMN